MKEIQGRAKQTRHVIDIPNLVELQLNSYRWFLEVGLSELFNSFSPIYDYNQNSSISLLDFTLGEPKYGIEECRERDMTFESPIKARVLLRQASKEEIETEVYLGDLPLMTDKGTFIINGAERVVVGQLQRSPGVYFKDNLDNSGKLLFSATIISQEGNWLEIESDSSHAVTVQVTGKKVPLTTLIRALGYFASENPSAPGTTEPLVLTVAEALEHFVLYRNEESFDETGRSTGKQRQKEMFVLTKFAAPVVDRKTGEILADADTEASEAVLHNLESALGSQSLVHLYSPCDSSEDMVKMFSYVEVIDTLDADSLYHRRPLSDIVDDRGNVLVPGGKLIHDKHTAQSVERALKKADKATLEVLHVNEFIEATLRLDEAGDVDSALLDICKRVRVGEPATLEAARNLLRSNYFDRKRYDLGRVGRYKINNKLFKRNEKMTADRPLSYHSVTREDLFGALRYIINLAADEGTTDDIDHLENKRVRSVGELLVSTLRTGFSRMEKVARERMNSQEIKPQEIISVKPIAASIKSFFGSSQLSQFMEQTNPLSELTVKRRLSALGPGGLSRQSAKLEVRDVHHSHYGRICPIETPEGPNIGLINSLAVYGRVDEYGFLETPFRKVKDGRVSAEIIWMTADMDNHYHIAPANSPLNEDGTFKDDLVQVRFEEGYPFIPPRQVDYIDIAPVQLISIATAMIPFIENDEATRALMGANMQKQAVPTLRPDAPLVKTGMERRSALDSGAVITARRSGIVTRVTADQVEVTTNTGRVDAYRLINMLRSNASTCITQRPIVNKGQRVVQGQVLTDGPCTDLGELALGQNVLVAFVSWGGYNYEDAILLSERLVTDDVFTSIHIEEQDKEARDTKIGPEEITRDIPNVGEDMLKDLDEDGIVRIGAEVRPEDILVGEVAPKGQGELTAEERLIIAIFGRRAEETRDVSLRVSHGSGGRVVDVKVFSRFKYIGARDKRIYHFCKKPETNMRDSQDGDLVRQTADDLPAGVNMLVRVYLAQKRKIMEGDKMAGRHGNKGVISKILPIEDMPFLPSGQPVDIVLNPLGVPSRMNIGQILETHLGYVGRHLDCSFVNPAFEAMTEAEIVEQMERLAAHFRHQTIEQFVNSELDLGMVFTANATPEVMLDQISARLGDVDDEHLEEISRILCVLPSQTREQTETKVLAKLKENAWARVGFDPQSGKTRLRDGLSGEFFDMDVTVGVIYMLKLAHLVDDKIHARSTGPYSLVTQQPLGGKAQFGGQRFGEMEVWALEAYGAAYTLQEILTIKSDDVLGRVKTYESIVKGDTILDPGVPESFKILVNELQSLGLKVTVLDDQDREIDLRDREDDIDPREDPVKAAARRHSRTMRVTDDEFMA